jgi:hypothetical protein
MGIPSGGAVTRADQHESDDTDTNAFSPWYRPLSASFVPRY